MRFLVNTQRYFILLVFFASFAILFAQSSYGFSTKARNALLVDLSTNSILLEKNARTPVPPASMSKIMTLYMVFERLQDGRLRIDDEFTVSERAWRKGGSKMFVEVGEKVSLKDLIIGIIVHSGNDACIVIAEGVSGSEEAFASEMNKTAQRIGLKSSNFTNATGWPDEQQYMSIYDMYLVSSKIINDFPELYKFFALKEFTYAGIKQYNRNHSLTESSFNVDGLKTGHTQESGYGVIVSAKQDGRRMLVLVHGLSDAKQRTNEVERLLRHGFRDFHNVKMVSKGQPIANVNIWMGQEEQVKLVAKQDLILTVPKRHDDLSVKLQYKTPIVAPISENDVLANLIFTSGEQKYYVPLYAKENIPAKSFFGKMMSKVEYILSSKE